MDRKKKIEIAEGEVAAESILTAIFSHVPIFGAAIVEAMFGYRGRLKQERLNRFTDMLRTEIQGLGISIEKDNLEVFTDLYEACAFKAVQTKSEKKMELFKNIILNHLTHNTEFDISIGFTDLVASLSDKEFEVLVGHLELDNKYYQLAHEVKKAIRRIESFKSMNWEDVEHKPKNDLNRVKYENLKTEAERLERERADDIALVSKLEERRKASYYNLTDDYFLFCKQSLFAKGLLEDSGIGGIGTAPFSLMSITEYGKTFIQYVKLS